MISILLALTIGQPELDAALSAALKRAVDRAKPSIVRIERVGAADEVSATLTGVVVDADGLIVSSAHAFEKSGAAIVVAMPDGNRIAATVLGVDKVLHLAFLKVAQKSSPIAPAPPEVVGVGKYVATIGRALLETPTVSLGVISAVNRAYGKAIQTDAKISPTNYGGPLIDLEGRALGVIVPLAPDESIAGTDLYDSGIGFAIPISDVLRSAARLKRGTLDRGLLGLAWRGKKPLDGPLAIEQLAWKSPATEAGLRRGDVIKSVDGKPVAFYSQFRMAVGKLYAGESVKMEVERNGAKVAAVVKAVSKLPIYRAPFLGLRLKETDGKLIVQQVEGPAAAAGLRANDVLVELDGPVRSERDVIEKLKRKIAGDAFALVVERGATREVKALRSIPWPDAIPSAASATTTSKSNLDEFPPPLKQWLLMPSSPPAALVVISGPSKADHWKAACERYAVAVTGFDERVETELLSLAISMFQRAVKLDARRTVVFGAGSEAESAANLVGPLAQAFAVDGGPIAPPPAQPDDVRRYLVLERPGGGSLVEAIKKARDDGVSIVEVPLADSKPEAAADVVARWAAGLGRF